MYLIDYEKGKDFLNQETSFWVKHEKIHQEYPKRIVHTPESPSHHSIGKQSAFKLRKNKQNAMALNLLQDESYTISEIAYKIGFNDPQYFSRYFRLKFGMSPKKYRELKKGQHHDIKRESSFVEKLKFHIEQHLDNQDFDLDSFANEMQMSRSTFYRRIKKITGFSPNEFIRSVRIEKANELLNKMPHYDVGDLAECVGFKDVKYFSRCFKEVYGLYPSKVLKERHKTA